MGKDKSKKVGKVSDVAKIIAGWEEKLSLAILNKNDQEAASIRRMLDYYRKKLSST